MQSCTCTTARRPTSPEPTEPAELSSSLKPCTGSRRTAITMFTCNTQHLYDAHTPSLQTSPTSCMHVPCLINTWGTHMLPNPISTRKAIRSLRCMRIPSPVGRETPFHQSEEMPPTHTCTPGACMYELSRVRSPPCSTLWPHERYIISRGIKTCNTQYAIRNTQCWSKSGRASMQNAKRNVGQNGLRDRIHLPYAIRNTY